MSLFIYVLADIIHLAKVLVLCNMFFSFCRRELEHKKIVWVAATTVMGGVSAFIYLYDNDDIEMFIYIVALVMLLHLFYREKTQIILIATLWMILVLSMIDIMMKVLVDISMDLIGLNGEHIATLCGSMISLAMVYMVGRAYRKNTTTGMNSIGIVNLFGFTFLLFVDTAVVSVVEFTNADLMLENHRNIYLVAVVLTIIGIFIQLAAVILLFTQRNVYKEKKILTEKYLDEQKGHYEYLEKRELETKKFRHDFRSHLELISNMAKNQEHDKIDSYLEKIQIKIDKLGNIVTVQNGIVDAIINQYYARALQQGIKMEVKGRFPIDFEMDVYDICTIFSNILSNAIEAAMETEEKYVSVECRYNDTNIIITVKNSFSREQRNAGALLKTRKGDLDYHGYGLENMMDSVHKYNGISDIETKDNMFILSIVFNNIGK